MNPTPDTKDTAGHDLLALAAAADHQAAIDAQLPGSQAMQAQQQAQAETDAQREADEITAALCLAVQMASYVEPLAPTYYSPDACSEIATSYMACAEKYGWTWHKAFATGPELKLGIAIAVPGFLMYRERQAIMNAPRPVPAPPAPEPHPEPPKEF